ncbi:dihydroorotate dehydrogenase [Pseudogulbenkiania sp. MAI-1]|uniref:dihydroorotate dehydrogenase n=1 Tax=Pseudogulbenkiania sp. MAI-1 TaxID=990370 RepID=UPI00045E82D5|nr:dihydroorotate dehydrogenase [Pseudogulbenkiania sp. MAI-1]
MSATPPFRWGRQPGLAGGLDKRGEQAAALLGAGFAAVEFGTVTPRPAPGQHAGVAALAAALARLAPRGPGGSAIGIGLGMTPHTPPRALAADWLEGLRLAAPAADYLSFNLSARAYRPLLAPEHGTLLRRALAAVSLERERLAKLLGRRLPLALKLPLESGAPALAAAAAAAGFDALILVLPETGQGHAALSRLARSLPGGPALIAVGGIRHAADVEAALDAGAHGVQVHRVFAELGPACLAQLGGASSERPVS